MTKSQKFAFLKVAFIYIEYSLSVKETTPPYRTVGFLCRVFLTAC